MNTQTIKIDIPSDIFLALNENEQEFTQNMKIATAVQLFQNEKLTFGKATQLAGLSRFEFEKELSKRNIPFSNPSIELVFNDVDKLNNI